MRRMIELALAVALVIAPFGARAEDSSEAERLAMLLALKPGMRVAEIGAGEGDLAFEMAQRVGPGGRIETFTIVYEPFQGLPDPPYAFGYVMLDGADTAIGGFFKGLDLSDPAKAAEVLKVGTRVKTVFAEKRIGDVLDFWFEPSAS